MVLLWKFSSGTIPIITISAAPLFFPGAIVCFAIALFTLATRRMAYEQASSIHSHMVTPHLRVNISNRRILTMQSANFRSLYPPYNVRWMEENSFSESYGRKVVIIGLKSILISPNVLKIFIPKQMFSPTEPGLVLMVLNWFAFSNDLDSHIASWRHKKTRRGPNIFALI